MGAGQREGCDTHYRKISRGGKAITRRKQERIERIWKEGKGRSAQSEPEGKGEKEAKGPRLWAIHPKKAQSKPQGAFCIPCAGSRCWLLSAGFLQGFAQRLWTSAYDGGKVTLASPTSSDFHSWPPHPTGTSCTCVIWHPCAVSSSRRERDVDASLGYLDLIRNLELHMTVGALTGAFLRDRGSVVCWCLAPLCCDRPQQRGAPVCDPALPWAR